MMSLGSKRSLAIPGLCKFEALAVPDCLTLYLLCLWIYSLYYPSVLFALLTMFLTLVCLLTLILDCIFVETLFLVSTLLLPVTCNSVLHKLVNITIKRRYTFMCTVLFWALALCYPGFGVCHFNIMRLQRCEQKDVLSDHFVFWPSVVHWANDAFPACPVSKACPLFCKKKALLA